MSSIAIITARGGSKRIPRKNIKDFLGRPIIKYSIKAALDSRSFDVVMVSTDDAEIADIARNAGADIPFLRSNETAGDFATTADVLLEVLKTYDEQGKTFDSACVIYPTAPFITAEKLRNAMELLEKEKYDSVLPVVKFDFPPQRAFVMKDTKLGLFSPSDFVKRSQDLEPMYHDAGQFCCFKVSSFIENRTLVTDNTGAIVLPESEVQDIDSIEDWEMAEIKYEMMLKRDRE